MTLSRLVFRSMRKNIKDYYLYFFALIFSVTLCFSFTTLQYNPSVQEALKESGTASAGFSAASYILYFIITFFVLYANHLFMKRRSKEIGLYQLIGMTKGMVVRLITIENIILFVLAISVGMLCGFFSSRLFAMVLLKIIEIDLVVQLSFSVQALKQSVIIFSILLIVILVQMVWIIRRVSLLSLFSGSKKADERIKRFSIFQMMMGFVGLFLIGFGYYQSTMLFNVEKSQVFNNLFLHMLVILGSTIIGTFLFFRYSVALIMNLKRSWKNGHLKLTDVLAVTPIMHRMKENAKSLTLITILTGFAVGIMSLSYISYYSAETNARQASPYDYILLNDKGLEFIEALHREGIHFEKDTYEVTQVYLNIEDLVTDELKDTPLFMDGNETLTPVISIKDFQQIEPRVTLNEGEAFLTSYANLLSEVLPLQDEQHIVVKTIMGEENKHSFGENIPLYITEIREDFFLYMNATFGAPVLVVTERTFEDIHSENNLQQEFHSQIGINLKNNGDFTQAEEIYHQLSKEREAIVGPERRVIPNSYEEIRKNGIATLGLTIFVTAFLGLVFLLTTGSILYFKQMSEAEDEKESYTTLRKIGFSTQDLMKGIYAKQAFNFGVPLVIGLLHSYFAVKSGWFLFGTELVAPLVITMSLYVAMYAVFAVLSTKYYKKVIKGSL